GFKLIGTELIRRLIERNQTANGRKPMLRKRGGQPGNRNALKHGNYSPRVRAARWAERQAEWRVLERRTIPVTDYDAFARPCDVSANSARKRRETKQPPHVRRFRTGDIHATCGNRNQIAQAMRNRAAAGERVRLHVMIADTLRLFALLDWQRTCLPFGELRSPATAGKLARMGVQRGYADLAFFHAAGSVAFLEVKRRDGRMSPDQQ